MSHCDTNPLVLLLSFNEIKPSLFTYIVSPASIPPRDIYSMCVCVCWVVISLCLQERNPGQLACDAWCAALWSTTVRPPWQSRGDSATPFPRRAAETAASPRQMEPPAFLVSHPQAAKRWSKRWRWDWAWPPSQMPGEGRDSDEALLGGCWAGTGAASAPSIPPLSAPQWWSPHSFPVLTPSHSHTRKVL